jgi:signal peptidase I
MEHDQENKPVQKKPWVAGLLSLLVPGLGHFYSGQIKKAIGFHAGVWICFLLYGAQPLGYSFTGLIIILFLGLAYNLMVFTNVLITTKKNRNPEPGIYDKWYAYLIIILALSFTFENIFEPLKIKFAKIQFARSSSTAMAPALMPGDRFAWKKTVEIEKKNIVVCKFAGDTGTLYVYRCMALPGETLEIQEGSVYINGNLSDIARPPCEIMAKDIPMETLFPFDPNLRWNLDFYGPILLPKKGMRVEINKENARYYGSVILLCENEPGLSINEQGLLVVNGEVAISYIFKHDYYFMLGDNRHDAADSRYRGPVPDSLIQGKALYIWWSCALGKIGKKL